jgi:hypothetical protein
MPAAPAQTSTPEAVRGTGPIVASVNETMAALNVGRAKLYELVNAGELESYLEGVSRKILWRSIHSYIDRRLATEAARRGRTTA